MARLPFHPASFPRPIGERAACKLTLSGSLMINEKRLLARSGKIPQRYTASFEEPGPLSIFSHNRLPAAHPGSLQSEQLALI